jgi:hypothetical protein
MTIAPVPIGGMKLPHRRHLLLVGLLVVAATSAWVLIAVGGESETTSVVRGSGVTVAETRALPAFTSVELAGANQVTIAVGAAQKVAVRADANLIPLVTTDVRDGGLVVGTEGSFETTNPMSVDVTVPGLDGLTLRGSGTMALYDVHQPELVVAVRGSGRVTASGVVGRLEVTVSGSGDAALRGLVADDVSALVSGSGTIEVVPTTTLDAEVSGTGAILFGGHPSHVTKNVTGTGAIVGG